MLSVARGHLTQLSVPKAFIAVGVSGLSNFMPALLPAVHQQEGKSRS